ncbi:hypothetical protein H6A60_09530 [Sutterella massiliensis]|uniref:DUF340 domain-containing protein n=1 Tax=Sutterella massiliensis TaxID=1816689 RepID=A0ABS2DTV3_9BURK|nr:hypothetical protein [Sutterella massiliensis]MBM6704722.1 hypothetical protein [Sutterella massiliensis]
MARILNKMYDVLFILLVTGFLVWIANMEAGSTAFSKSAIGIILMVVITAIGVLISMLPGFKRLPMVFWVSTCAVVASLPAFPLSAEILSYTKEVGFLPITTPILAYAGLSLGKDMEGFKHLSWRIVPVALAVAAGSFLCATALAEVMLHLEGIF